MAKGEADFKTDIRSAEAGLKYFLFGSTASAFTLFGISLIYGMTGSTSLAQIAVKLGSLEPLLAVGIVMTLIGFARDGRFNIYSGEWRLQPLWAGPSGDGLDTNAHRNGDG